MIDDQSFFGDDEQCRRSMSPHQAQMVTLVRLQRSNDVNHLIIIWKSKKGVVFQTRGDGWLPIVVQGWKIKTLTSSVEISTLKLQQSDFD